MRERGVFNVNSWSLDRLTDGSKLTDATRGERIQDQRPEMLQNKITISHDPDRIRS